VAKFKVAVEVQNAYLVQEAADILGIGIATLWRWIKKGKVSSFKVTLGLHSQTLISASEVERLKAESSPGKGALTTSRR
jgi:excisionase family DNA binding protein